MPKYCIVNIKDKVGNRFYTSYWIIIALITDPLSSQIYLYSTLTGNNEPFLGLQKLLMIY